MLNVTIDKILLMQKIVTVEAFVTINMQINKCKLKTKWNDDVFFIQIIESGVVARW